MVEMIAAQTPSVDALSLVLQTVFVDEMNPVDLLREGPMIDQTERLIDTVLMKRDHDIFLKIEIMVAMALVADPPPEM